MSQIVIIGDSITYGAWDMEGGWAARLRKFVDHKANDNPDYYHLIYNLGVSGNNTTDVLKRFEFEVQQRVKEEGEMIIIFAVGTNDSQLFAGKFRTEPKQFAENLQELFALAQKYAKQIIFVGLLPVDEVKTAPVEWDKERFYYNENIARNNQAIKDLCQQNGLLFIDIYDNFIKTDYQPLLEDGLHPNTEGHEKMFEIIKDQLLKNIII